MTCPHCGLGWACVCPRYVVEPGGAGGFAVIDLAPVNDASRVYRTFVTDVDAASTAARLNRLQVR